MCTTIKIQIASVLAGLSLLVCSLVALRLGFEIKHELVKSTEIEATIFNLTCNSTNLECLLDFEYVWRSTKRVDSIIQNYKSTKNFPVVPSQMAIWVDDNGNVIDAPIDNYVVSYVFLSAGIGLILSIMFFAITFSKCGTVTVRHDYYALK
jgi:hypothetical protein